MGVLDKCGKVIRKGCHCERSREPASGRVKQSPLKWKCPIAEGNALIMLEIASLVPRSQ